MPRIWLSLGSNIDREANICGALQALDRHFGPLVISRVFESEAVGFEGDPFYNLVVGLESESSIDDLMGVFRGIESDFGRVRGDDKFAARTLDIDLLTYGDQVLADGGMELPRDEILKYAFVLQPLSEVAGDERHPVEEKTYAELWQAFDASGQKLWPVEFEYK
ncbi:2-amino-4-hydroxy-6-hydroxymethyldihydropteridine diphosphokinase [Solemya velesiana gill symbiont]|uniref:2-amino-4-hydroxy-6-hydroxymethyldihydropteridine diphosphokinase n=1 Tax=Solemya velesiana gill symbiont TaxID=1918948 RepID=A0A1T2KWH1_9GAMM|nr:2-amino-4-hydroxy-6-hydroxymethyldihydropteridine diphosphokinase [Solemya velesiana gill symbiont]OOZ37209.1 2-amino-4-hydroxy-6-hydroxymethyldihydropteridine diphosphokinase [Solemya velesiana gill symbiont]